MRKRDEAASGWSRSSPSAAPRTTRSSRSTTRPAARRSTSARPASTGATRAGEPRGAARRPIAATRISPSPGTASTTTTGPRWSASRGCAPATWSRSSTWSTTSAARTRWPTTSATCSSSPRASPSGAGTTRSSRPPAGRSTPINRASPRLEHATSVDGDDRVYRFAATDVAKVDAEPAMPGTAETAPYLHVSTYATWAEVGAWYWHLVEDQLAPDDDIRRDGARPGDAADDRRGARARRLQLRRGATRATSAWSSASTATSRTR